MIVFFYAVQCSLLSSSPFCWQVQKTLLPFSWCTTYYLLLLVLVIVSGFVRDGSMCISFLQVCRPESHRSWRLALTHLEDLMASSGVSPSLASARYRSDALGEHRSLHTKFQVSFLQKQYWFFAVKLSVVLLYSILKGFSSLLLYFSKEILQKVVDPTFPHTNWEHWYHQGFLLEFEKLIHRKKKKRKKAFIV